ncbi:hypothetical protein BDF20DRAFT_830552 [Mycotypha africana]|uniref:uncharacterized protein n=1 Tax=Mycotypha africana TaxID=64632 RepID=UPI0023018427|nr:uncharacterized protein BDF20DRAFT_830552 [Mycotypha africana]KAI8966944.1 hypothetical protein BDF20DRAFT_830552 [Mycotypha africana]
MLEFLFSNPHNIAGDRKIYVDATDNSNYLTLDQVKSKILKATAGLKREFGLKKGDVVAICSPNHIDYPVLLHATVAAGGVVAAIDYEAHPDKIAEDLDTVQAKLIITHKDNLTNVLAGANIFGMHESRIITFGNVSVHGLSTVDDTILSKEEYAEPMTFTEDQLKNDPAYLYFTSGTTGRKKAVIMTQGGLLASMHVMEDWDVYEINLLAYTEFHHASSLLIVLHLAIIFGYTCYVVSHYDIRTLCEAIEKYKIHVTATQPYILAAFAKDRVAEEYDLSSLKLVVSAGAALDNSVTLLAKERLGLTVINGYGMTEVLGLFNMTPELTLKNSLGTLAAGFEARVVDEEGKDVPRGQMGELWIRGPTVTKGYYRNPEATASAIDADGFLHTGDLVTIDENNQFYYVDRCKDMIKYRLTHIYPSEIENILFTHPKVADCAVIGVYNAELITELPRAYVHLVDGEKHSQEVEQELQKYCDSRLPDEKHLRGGVVIVDDFPRTASGKIQRRLLRQQANEEAKVSVVA